MKLSQLSLKWALDSVLANSDGDLFPKILEMNGISEIRDAFIDELAKTDLENLTTGPARRFIVPKDDLAYRQATQLDPQDSIILTALIHEYGKGVEDRRLTTSQIFSYRFLPRPDGDLYNGNTSWNDFWTKAKSKSASRGVVLYCDISDFYNQISHHTVENQLIASGFPNQATKWVISLLESTTSGVSRGIPIGPHSMHLIAESTMIPIDNSLRDSGIDFIRFVDDILVFASCEEDAKSQLSKIVQTLDRQQRLSLQRHKTRIYLNKDFQSLCDRMVTDRPINSDENDLIHIVKKYSGGNPYRTITFNQISPADWKSITEATINRIINDYLSNKPIDYVRLQWFYRRLAQIGHPGALNVTLNNLNALMPCFANICFYLSSVHEIKSVDWPIIGDRLTSTLDSKKVKDNEYFLLSILSLFSRNPELNHISKLIALFSNSPAFARREIFLAARENSSFDWIREHKESFLTMDSWQKLAYVYCVSGLPADEKKYFLNSQRFTRPLEKHLAHWSKTRSS